MNKQQKELLNKLVQESEKMSLTTEEINIRINEHLDVIKHFTHFNGRTIKVHVEPLIGKMVELVGDSVTVKMVKQTVVTLKRKVVELNTHPDYSMKLDWLEV